jgi:hypothetical protein
MSKNKFLKSFDRVESWNNEYLFCSEMGISMERRIRKKKRMDGDGSTDAAMTFDAELRREMLSVIDMLTEEIYSRFQQVHDLANKYAVLAPSNLLDDNYDCQLGEVDDEVEKEEFLVDGPLEVLSFIQRYRLGDSVPNIVILLRIFLTRAISVASCERSFSKLKLIKNYLRSTMSQTRLTDLAVLSIERELADGLNFDTVIKNFAERKAQRVCKFCIEFMHCSSSFRSRINYCEHGLNNES